MLELIYAKIPKINCKGLCSHSCGPIMAFDPEVKRFESKTGKKFPNAADVFASGTMTCPHLDVITDKCVVYQHRPLICRLWGVADGMPCPHGCTPERRMTDIEAHDLIEQTAEVGA